MEYKIKKEELLEFAKRVYLEGCGGYMDLVDSKSEIILDEFLKDKNPLDSIVNSISTHYGRTGESPYYSNRSILHAPPPPPPPTTSFHERVSNTVGENGLIPEITWSTINNVTWTMAQHVIGADFTDNTRSPLHSNTTPDIIWPNEAINDGIAIRNDIELRNL